MRAAALLMLLVSGCFGQRSYKEYIRLNGRVIAVENNAVTMTVTPPSATLGPNGTLTLTPSVSGTNNPGYTWDPPAKGTLTGNQYQAPGTFTPNEVVTLTVRSNACPQGGRDGASHAASRSGCCYTANVLDDSWRRDSATVGDGEWQPEHIHQLVDRGRRRGHRQCERTVYSSGLGEL